METRSQESIKKQALTTLFTRTRATLSAMSRALRALPSVFTLQHWRLKASDSCSPPSRIFPAEFYLMDFLHEARQKEVWDIRDEANNFKIIITFKNSWTPMERCSSSLIELNSGIVKFEEWLTLYHQCRMVPGSA